MQNSDIDFHQDQFIYFGFQATVHDIYRDGTDLQLPDLSLPLAVNPLLTPARNKRHIKSLVYKALQARHRDMPDADSIFNPKFGQIMYQTTPDLMTMRQAAVRAYQRLQTVGLGSQDARFTAKDIPAEDTELPAPSSVGFPRQITITNPIFNNNVGIVSPSQTPSFSFKVVFYHPEKPLDTARRLAKEANRYIKGSAKLRDQERIQTANARLENWESISPSLEELVADIAKAGGTVLDRLDLPPTQTTTPAD